MTMQPPTLPKRPAPIRDDGWHEVRCASCGWHLVDAKPGSEIRKKCPECKATTIRSIDREVAA